METTRFDRLTVSLSDKLTRRRALAASAASVAGAGLTRAAPAVAQDATPEAQDSEHPAFLFVQLANSGTWTPKPGEDGVYELTLTSPGQQTIYFSDRPDRIVGTLPTDTFLEGLGFSPFEPPNAAVVVTTPDGERDVLVVELFNPVYSQRFGEDAEEVLTYQARVIDAYRGEGLEEWVPQADDDQLPSAFSDASLFIDDCADISGCYRYHSSTSGGVYIGEVPGGPYGRCWYWRDLNCYPCSGMYDYLKYDQMCNDTYWQCQNSCTTHTCVLGIC